MSTAGINELCRSEDTARAFLVACCRVHGCACPRCTNHGKCYRLADGRQRCSRCEYTFHDFTGRWIKRSGLSCRQWLLLTHLFAQDFSLKAICHWVGIAYNTAFKAVTTLRQAVAAQYDDLMPLLDSGFQAEDSIPVFERRDDRQLAFAYRPMMRAAAVIDMPVRKYTWRNLLFCDPYGETGGYVLCFDGEFRRQCSLERSDIKPLPVNGASPWSALRDHMNRFQGVTPKRFPLYLKEFEFRQAHPGSALFPLFVHYLCAWEPQNSKSQRVPCFKRQETGLPSRASDRSQTCLTHAADTMREWNVLCQNLREQKNELKNSAKHVVK